MILQVHLNINLSEGHLLLTPTKLFTEHPITLIALEEGTCTHTDAEDKKL